jgi:hypothetical protein
LVQELNQIVRETEQFRARPETSRGCFPRLEDVAAAKPHRCAINRCLFIQDEISGAFALYAITAKITCTVQVLLNLKSARGISLRFGLVLIGSRR